MSSLNNSKIQVVGCDVFVVQKEIPIVKEPVGKFKLEAIANRGAKIWPNVNVKAELVDVFRCRYLPTDAGSVAQGDILDLLKKLEERGLEWVHVEKLLKIDGKNGFSELKGA
jgi:isocitrate dehydrogenase